MKTTENIKKVVLNVVNNKEEGTRTITVDASNDLMGRALVVYNLNARTPVMYQISAKCRNTDIMSVAKAYVKMMLSIMRARYVENHEECVTESKLTKLMTQAEKDMRSKCTTIALTDKDGRVIESTAMTMTEIDGTPVKLNKMFRFTSAMPLVKSVVAEGKAWDDAKVIEQLKVYCMAAILHLDFNEKMDIEIGKAADMTEKLEKATEKLEKATEKAKKTAKAEAAKAADKAVA